MKPSREKDPKGKDSLVMKPEDMKVLVIGPQVWGKGDTVSEALRKAQKPRHYITYICHPDTRVDEMGYINYPKDMPPKEIDRKEKKIPKGGKRK